MAVVDELPAEAADFSDSDNLDSFFVSGFDFSFFVAEAVDLVDFVEA